MKPRRRLFFSTASAAKELGVSNAHIARLTTKHGIEPLKFEAVGQTKHFWTADHLGLIRRHLKAS